MTRIRNTPSRLGTRVARRWLAGTVVLVLGGAGIAIAQYRVNTQIYGNTSSSVRYGRSYQPNYARQPTYNLLPSENRNLVYKSGALPSTLRMNYASVGPLAPQGVAAYVPEPANFRSSAVTKGNYVNTLAPTRITNAPIPAVTATSIPRNPAAVGSMRYALPTPGAGAMSGFSLSSASSSSVSSPLWQKAPSAAVRTTPQSGSIKYSWNLAG